MSRSMSRSTSRSRLASRSLAVAGVALALAACGNPTRRALPQLLDQVSSGDRDPKTRLRAELQAEVLDGYERDELPEIEAAVLPRLGPTRIGVGPGDFLVDQELLNASSRWPLMIDPEAVTTVRSKRLDLKLAIDLSAGWIIDEVSWRIQVCNRVLVIPLRITALYARDGDRWVLAVEHISSGAQLPTVESLVGRSVTAAEVAPTIASAVAASVATTFAAPIASSPLLSAEVGTALLGPGWSQEWHDAELVGKQLVPGTLTVEEQRIGTVGYSPDSATVAFWVGNLIAQAPSGARTRLRASYVLERRGEGWVVVQGHVSLPVDDETLARTVVGSALVSLNPLVAKCSDVSGGAEKDPMPVPSASAGSAAPTSSSAAKP